MSASQGEGREEVRGVSMAELKSGIQLSAGHPIVLVVDGPASTLPRRPSADSPAPAASPSDAVLREANWVETDLSHGDLAAIEVLADAADGHRVRITVEVRQGADWAPLKTLEVAISGGRARAEFRVENPVHGGDPFSELEAAELRFHADLI